VTGIGTRPLRLITDEDGEFERLDYGDETLISELCADETIDISAELRGRDIKPPADDTDVTERAQANIRDALASLEKVPGAALAGDQHEQLLAAVESTEALEKGLTNEAEQQRGDNA